MTKQVLIWDLPLRLFHWMFAFAILGCWATHELGSDYIDWHMQCGYVAMGLLVFRLCWGFVGTKHSRFLNFIPTPNKIINYLRSGQASGAGHNPLGSVMVFVMLGLVLLQVSSGLFADDEIFTTGPYFNALGGDVDNIMSTIHHNAFDFILVAVLFHVAAVMFYQYVKRQQLVRPMVTGHKNAQDINPDDAIKNSRLLLAIVIAALCTAFVYWLVVINVPVVEEYY